MDRQDMKRDDAVKIVEKTFKDCDNFRGFYLVFKEGSTYSFKSDYDMRAMISLMELEVAIIKNKILVAAMNGDVLKQVKQGRNPIVG